jgi:putative membrane protein
MRKLAILLGGAIALAACNTTPAAPPPSAMIDPNNPLFAPAFMAQAASGNQFEIDSSQLALQASSNPGVRNFANLMIADHTRLGQMFGAAVQSAGLTPPPPGLLPAQQAALDQLRAAGTGPGFDAAYLQAQLGAHQGALALMQNFAAGGDVPALQNFASTQAIPMIQMHLQQVQLLQTAAAAPPPPPPLSPPSTRRAGERG